MTAKKLEKIAQFFGWKYFKYGTFWRNYYKEHQKELMEFYKLLEDEKSVEVVQSVVKFRKTRKDKYLTRVAEKDLRYFVNQKNESVSYNYCQYFPNFISLSGKEVFVDCGSYVGDSIISLLAHTNGAVKKVHAFEPMKSNIENLKINIDSLGIRKITSVHNVGLSDREKDVRFTFDLSGSRISDESDGERAKLVVFDKHLTDKEKSEITFIKMDIEGSEREALKGMAETISKYKPKLAICIYHLPDDYFVIPKLIQSINPYYKFFVRQHEYLYASETVLYAI
ncbi:MAG: FkbM family methyltransferase [Dysgonamonadaceae bacterium]|jgi:FkbM family methyltransferase|nr:FkbM family methyltransferase [Dysgonamonadaceae bacterium]